MALPPGGRTIEGMATATTTPILRPVQEHDLDEIAGLSREAFREQASPARWLRDGWVLERDGRVDGAMTIEQLGQFVGGAAVPAAIVDYISVRADARGRGLGLQLMAGLVERLRASGVALASGCPSTHRFYRQFGWEVCGTRTIWTARLNDVPAAPAEGRVEQWGERDLDAVRACYRRFAADRNGPLDRPRHWWEERVLRAGERPLERILVRRDGEVRGYLLYEQHPAPAALPYYWIDCRELVWLDGDAARALLAFLARQGTLGRHVDWPGAPDEPLLRAFEQQGMTVRHYVPWISRLIDVPAALAARSYPRGIELELTLRVVDPLVEANACPLRLAVADGRGLVEPAESAAIELDVDTLTPLYTGWADPRSLARLGGLRGAGPAELDLLAVLFAGPAAWLPEVL